MCESASHLLETSCPLNAPFPARVLSDIAERVEWAERSASRRS